MKEEIFKLIKLQAIDSEIAGFDKAIAKNQAIIAGREQAIAKKQESIAAHRAKIEPAQSEASAKPRLSTMMPAPGSKIGRIR